MTYHSIAYGKDKSFENTEGILNLNVLLLANKNKTLELYLRSELQLLTRLNNIGFGKIIHQG